MSRLSTESVEKAVDAVQAMDRAQKERLADDPLGQDSCRLDRI